MKRCLYVAPYFILPTRKWSPNCTVWSYLLHIGYCRNCDSNMWRKLTLMPLCSPQLWFSTTFSWNSNFQKASNPLYFTYFKHISCQIWGSQSGDHEEYYPLGYETMKSSRSATFQKNISTHLPNCTASHSRRWYSSLFMLLLWKNSGNYNIKYLRMITGLPQ